MSVNTLITINPSLANPFQPTHHRTPLLSLVFTNRSGWNFHTMSCMMWAFQSSLRPIWRQLWRHIDFLKNKLFNSNFWNKIFGDEIPSPICCLICYTFEKNKKMAGKNPATPLNDIINLLRHWLFCYLTDFDKWHRSTE